MYYKHRKIKYVHLFLLKALESFWWANWKGSQAAGWRLDFCCRTILLLVKLLGIRTCKYALTQYWYQISVPIQENIINQVLVPNIHYWTKTSLLFKNKLNFHQLNLGEHGHVLPYFTALVLENSVTEFSSFWSPCKILLLASDLLMLASVKRGWNRNYTEHEKYWPILLSVFAF